MSLTSNTILKYRAFTEEREEKEDTLFQYIAALRLNCILTSTKNIDISLQSLKHIIL